VPASRWARSGKIVNQTPKTLLGAPRVHAELRDDDGVRVGRKRVARLMRTAGLVGCHRRRRRGLTRPDPAATPAPDLVGRLFDPGAPDRTWLADISYIPTDGGRCQVGGGLGAREVVPTLSCRVR
jgi:transposase InsO family protein